MKLFNLFANMFGFKRAVLPAPMPEVQLLARFDSKGNVVNLITLDPLTLLEKTKTL